MSDLPHVTAILSRVGLGPDLSGIAESVLEVARARGTAVHAAIEALTYGYEPEIPDGVGPYLDGYRKFLAETGYRPVVHEVEVVDPRWQYVGHADGVGWIAEDRVLVDWKATAVLDVDAVSYQLAAYRQAWQARRPTEPIKRLIAVQFKPGAYRMHEVGKNGGPSVAEATSVWQAAVVVYRAIERRAR